MSVGFLDRSFDKWNIPERKEITQGINLADFGRENNIEFDVSMDVSVEATEVFVSSEYLKQPGDQRRSVDYTVYDKSVAGDLPAGEVYWEYAEMPDGTVELQDIRTIVRANGQEQRQSIHRMFSSDGSVKEEEVKVDGKRFKLRTYATDGDYDGSMVYDDYYNLAGDVERRVVFYQKVGDTYWHSYSSMYKNGEERTERGEGSLSGPPALQGIPQLNKYVEAPALEYSDPNKITYREVH